MRDSVMGADALRVLMTADAVGGVWTYALDLAEALRPHGVECTIAVLGPAPQGDQRAAAKLAGVELKLLGGTLDWTAQAPSEMDLAGMALAALAAELRPGIIHLNGPAIASHARFPAPVIAACHSCVKTWWSAVKGGAALPADLEWRSAMTARGYAAADVLIAPSRAFAVATQQAYGLSAAPRVVHNGRRGNPASAPAAAAARIPTGPFAFTAGRLWDEGKGVATLDRAAHNLQRPVFAAGPTAGPNGAAVELSALTLLGRLPEDEVRAWLGARPMFVSPALYEPFGLTVLEAAQAGCALALSDIASFRELWDGCAVFTPAGDEAALASTLSELAGDATQRAQLGGLARERSRRYGVEAMAKNTLAVYREVLASRASGRSALGAVA